MRYVFFGLMLLAANLYLYWENLMEVVWCLVYEKILGGEENHIWRSWICFIGYLEKSNGLLIFLERVGGHRIWNSQRSIFFVFWYIFLAFSRGPITSFVLNLGSGKFMGVLIEDDVRMYLKFRYSLNIDNEYKPHILSFFFLVCSVSF